jgi:hypothetical protein
MTLTDQQRQIVAHFASYMPAMKRAPFAVLVTKALRDRDDDGTGQRTVRACVDAINGDQD